MRDQQPLLVLNDDLFNGVSDTDRELQFRHNSQACIDFLDGKVKDIDFRPTAVGSFANSELGQRVLSRRRG